jgi:hypothetical protein
MSMVGYVEQVRELNRQMKDIRSATNYQEVSPTIEKTQRTLTEILSNKPCTRHFDNALRNQFILLDFLKEKTWISTKDYRSIFEQTLAFGNNHRPSEVPEEIDEYHQFLECKAEELRSYHSSVESSE